MADLSDSARASLEALLGTRIKGMAPVGGGCISPAWRVTLRDGGMAFAKASDVPGLLGAEAHSLGALAGAVRGGSGHGESPCDMVTGVVRGGPGLRVPEVLAVSAEWLVLEWLEPGRARPGAWRRAGEGLARLHAAGGPRGGVGGRGEEDPAGRFEPDPAGQRRGDDPSGQRSDEPFGAHRRVSGPTPPHRFANAVFGWDRDNFIGPLPQTNTRADTWAQFWRDRRLVPQAEMASERLGSERLTRLEALYDRLEELLAPGQADGPSLLHGDLWSGNLLMTEDGAALVDPTSFYGHREVDLAMATLFGGVPAVFFSGYEAAWPLAPGWERRRAVYQLYYVLVHVNLFGDGYLRGVDGVLEGSENSCGPGPEIE